MKPRISSKQPLWLILILAAMVGLLTVPVWAQQEEPPRWGRDQVETIIIGKYSTELNLTPQQAEQFFPRFRQFQNQVEDVQRDQMARREEMEKLSQEPGAEPAQVNKLLQQQSANVARMAELKQQFLGDVSSFLSPQQISRCSILMDDLPRRVHEFISQQRRGGRTDDQGYGRGFGPRHGGDRPDMDTSRWRGR